MEVVSESPAHHEMVAKLACCHFNLELPKTGKPTTTCKEWTTLAAIIKSVESETECSTSSSVVAMATGTKCLGKTELSSKGDLLSDSHAEVLTRRAFLLYIYDQIDCCLKKPSKSVFEVTQPQTVSSTNFKFTLRPQVKFHLFISHSPCGDAAIFSSGTNCNYADDVDSDEPQSKRIKLDNEVNRTGAKLHGGAMGFEEIQEVGKCRIKPGKGVPTLCMSCSDKIAKWQVLGLQGSLLGNFISEPIRLTSIVIGSGVPFNKSAMERAIFQRFLPQILANTKYSSLATPIPAAVLQSEATNFMELEGQIHPTPASICWSLCEKTKLQPKTVQVSVNGRKQGVTKKSAEKPASRLDICRKNLFFKFVTLLRKCKVDVRDDWTYREAKELNTVYNETWTWLKNNVMLGWTAKPDNLTDFGFSP